MNLPRFVRSILGPGRFPRLEGQGLPDPTNKDPNPVVANPAERIRGQNRKVKILPKARNPNV